VHKAVATLALPGAGVPCVEHIQMKTQAAMTTHACRHNMLQGCGFQGNVVNHVMLQVRWPLVPAAALHLV
jgi:hypothetical protein